MSRGACARARRSTIRAWEPRIRAVAETATAKALGGSVPRSIAVSIDAASEAMRA
jgi:phage baseplate assembly protein W